MTDIMAKRAPMIKQGVELYERFREEEAEFLDVVDYDCPKVAILIGECDAVEYTTRRAGKVELYRHEFDEKSKPLLCSTFDGKQIFVIGGRYNFTEDGIKDY